MRGATSGALGALLPAAMLLGALSMAGCSPSGTESSTGSRPPIEVRASVDRAVATVGDRVTYALTIDRDAELEAEVPALDPDLAGLTVIESGGKEIRQEGDRVIEEHPLRLRVDQVGSYVLPAVSVRYRHAPQTGTETAAEGDAEGVGEGEREGDAETAGPDWETVETSPIFVEVESVLDRAGEAGEEVADIRGLKPLERPAEGPPWIRIAAGASVALLLLGLFVWLRNRDRSAAEAPPRPAHEVALERLAALARKDRSDPQAVHRLYFELSEVVRVYIEARFGLNATDLTTEEIVVSLPGVRGLETEPALALRRFLIATDRVKFADHQPSEDEVRADLERARDFVESTLAQPEIANEAGEGERLREEAA